MKTLKFITLTLFLSIAFLSCSNDDDNSKGPEPTIQEQILGKWYLHSKRDVGSNLSLDLDECYRSSYYEFLLDGIFHSQFFETESDGSCSLDNSTNATYEVGEYEGKDAFLITLDDGSIEGAIIISISETELVIEESGFGVRHTTFIKR